MRMMSEHKKTVSVLMVLLIGFFVWTLTAGDLNPPGVPTGTMRTLNEIYAAAFEPVVVPTDEVDQLGGMYLYVSGIPGDSIEINHKDWIEIKGYTHHVENGADPKAEGHPKFSNLLIAKETDSTSVPLMLKCCNNDPMEQVILERTMTVGASRIVYYRLTLTNPRVTYIAPVSARTSPYEVVSFGSYDTVKWEYRKVDIVTGQPGPWQTETWDVGNDGGES